MEQTKLWYLHCDTAVMHISNELVNTYYLHMNISLALSYKTENSEDELRMYFHLRLVYKQMFDKKVL